MTTKRTAPMGPAKPCRSIPTLPPIQIPSGEFGRIFDHVMEGCRLVLALHRVEEDRKTGCLSSPQQLIAWQAFLALSSACDELGHHAGYEVRERDPE